MLAHKDEHFSGRSGWLRAAVLGANDGLLSTASIIVRVGRGFERDGAGSGRGPCRSCRRRAVHGRWRVRVRQFTGRQ